MGVCGGRVREGWTRRESRPRVLLSEEKATVRCTQRHPGSNSSAGSQAPLRRTTAYVHGSDSLTRFHRPLCSKEHVELIPSGFINDRDEEQTPAHPEGRARLKQQGTPNA